MRSIRPSCAPPQALECATQIFSWRWQSSIARRSWRFRLSKLSFWSISRSEPMPIAIQEDLLSGTYSIEKFQHARDLGADGVEVWSANLTDRVPEIIMAIQQTGLRIA